MAQAVALESQSDRATPASSWTLRKVQKGLGSEWARLTASAASFDSALATMAATLSREGTCDILFAIRQPVENGALRLERLTATAIDFSPVEQAELLLLAQEALRQRSGLSMLSMHATSRTIAVVPLFETFTDPAAPCEPGATPDVSPLLAAGQASGRCLALAGVRAAPPFADVPHADLLSTLELMMVLVTRESGIATTKYQTAARGAAALVELMGHALDQPSFMPACATLARNVREYLACQGVWLAMRRSQGDCEIVGFSGMTTSEKNIAGTNGSDQKILEQRLTDRGVTDIATMTSVLNEAVLRERLTIWPPVDPTDRWGCLAHRQAAEHMSVATESGPGSVTLVSTPLRNSQGIVIGAWLLAGHRESMIDATSLAWIRAAEQPVATVLEASRLVHRGVWQRLRERLAGRQAWWSLRKIIAALVLSAGLFAIPLPHDVTCQCELQPSLRRYITAPFDGRLERGVVKLGDRIAKGELLARMDGHDIELELSAIAADLHRASKRRDGELAEHDFGSAHLSHFEMQRLQARSELLKSRIGQLDIRSPIEGIVISGELERVEGAALKIGQRLYEIAPLERMAVELSIPEDDISFVRPELPVTARLEGSQTNLLEGTLTHIHPRSEIRQERNVFVGEWEVKNTAGTLRPGMRGTARIRAGWRPLGWIWFHKAWERAITWFGW